MSSERPGVGVNRVLRVFRPDEVAFRGARIVADPRPAVRPESELDPAGETEGQFSAFDL
jgi:hypothetical protein